MAIAGLTLSLAFCAAPAFAQVGGGGTAGVGSAGMPGAGADGLPMSMAPSAGSPGTQAPASAAPVGEAASNWMSNESVRKPRVGENYRYHPVSTMKYARELQTVTGRDIAAARVDGLNIARAGRHRWLGGIALQKGDVQSAINYFKTAEADLDKAGYPNGPSNAGITAQRANQTSQSPGAVNTNPYRGATAESAY